jgi:hypothetical protein
MYTDMYIPRYQLIVEGVVLSRPDPVRVAREALHGPPRVIEPQIPDLNLPVIPGGYHHHRLIRVVINRPVKALNFAILAIKRDEAMAFASINT